VNVIGYVIIRCPSAGDPIVNDLFVPAGMEDLCTIFPLAPLVSFDSMVLEFGQKWNSHHASSILN